MGSNQTKWQKAIATNICPNGHNLDDCHRLRWSSKRGKFEHYCRFQRSQRRYANFRSKSYPHQVMLSKPGKVMHHKDQFLMVHIIFVCGHTTLYTRRALNVNEVSYPGDLWCERCVEWKVVHYASNLHKDMPGWIYHELEVKE